MGVGEIYLNSIERDGTGQGMDLSIINKIKKYINIPIILAGGLEIPNIFMMLLKIIKLMQ